MHAIFQIMMRLQMMAIAQTQAIHRIIQIIHHHIPIERRIRFGLQVMRSAIGISYRSHHV